MASFTTRVDRALLDEGRLNIQEGRPWGNMAALRKITLRCQMALMASIDQRFASHGKGQAGKGSAQAGAVPHPKWKKPISMSYPRNKKKVLVALGDLGAAAAIEAGGEDAAAAAAAAATAASTLPCISAATETATDPFQMLSSSSAISSSLSTTAESDENSPPPLTFWKHPRSSACGAPDGIPSFLKERACSRAVGCACGASSLAVPRTRTEEPDCLLVQWLVQQRMARLRGSCQ